MIWYPSMYSHKEDHFCKKRRFHQFSQWPPCILWYSNHQIISFEAYRVITLVNFSLLQLLSGLCQMFTYQLFCTWLEKFSIIPFIFEKSCIFFSSFAVSFCNQIVICLCWVAQQRYWCCGYRNVFEVKDIWVETSFNEWTVY